MTNVPMETAGFEQTQTTIGLILKRSIPSTKKLQ